MPNIISKQINIELLQNETALHSLKPKFIVGDSLIFNIKILEEPNKPKDLTDCKIDVKALRVRENSLVEQRYEDSTTDYKIEILTPIEGTIRAKLKPNFTSKGDVYRFYVTVRDNDENITVQPFTYTVLNSIDETIVENASDDVSTLRDLNDLIIQYENELVGISSTVDVLEKEIQSDIANINHSITALEDDVELRIDEIDKVMSGIENSLKINAVKIHKLTPYIPQGSNYVYLTTPLISLSDTRNLAKCAYNLQVCGKVANDLVIHNSLSDVLFLVNLDSSNKEVVQVNTYSRIDLDIQGRKIEPSVVFSNLTTQINPTTTTMFNLLVKTKINKNYINSVSGYLIPYGLDVL